jgi:hypothetical protein
MGDSIPKISKAKRAGGEAQVVEHLPIKFKILSSTTNTTKKKKITNDGIVVHAYNPSTQEDEDGDSRVRSQPGLHSKTLHQNSNQKEMTNHSYSHLGM